MKGSRLRHSSAGAKVKADTDVMVPALQKPALGDKIKGVLLPSCGRREPEFNSISVQFQTITYCRREINVRLLLSVGLLLVILNTAPALTATVKLLGKNSNGEIELSISGEIKQGDARLFSEILDATGYRISNDDGTLKSDARRAIVYLDSPGGSYSEGLALARVFLTKVVTTHLKADAECDSACAIAFLGGTEEGVEETRVVNRVVEVGGKLGFHAPYLVVPDGNYNQTDVDLSYSVAVSSIAELLRLSKVLGLSADVLPEILEVAPNNMKYLETVDDFARFNVEVSPSVKLPNLTRSLIENACRNGYAWQFSKVLGAGAKELIQAGDIQGKTFQVLNTTSKYFSFDAVPAARVVSGTAVGGEGTTAWCIFDVTRIDGTLKSSCRGFVWAEDLAEAIKRAKNLDTSDAFGNTDETCEQNGPSIDGYNFAPSDTKIGDVQGVISQILSKETSVPSQTK